MKTLPDKQLTFTTLRNRAELLMLNYQINHQPVYIQAATSSFLLADTLLTDMRNNQVGEESILYWRELSRNFFNRP